jgi:hypothetical protein
VGRRIVERVRLDLDDRPADTVDQELGSDQLARDLVDVASEELPDRSDGEAGS